MNTSVFYSEFKPWTHCFGRRVSTNIVWSVKTERYYHYSSEMRNGEVLYRVQYAHAYNTYSRAKKPC